MLKRKAYTSVFDFSADNFRTTDCLTQQSNSEAAVHRRERPRRQTYVKEERGNNN